MQLSQGKIGKTYQVIHADLPVQLEKRMEALGMTEGTNVGILHFKRGGTMVITIRGTRFAIGKGISQNIEVEEVKG
ncbi:MAG: FeoA family protein [Oscillospiraceae bacterium]|nr:FeoA family protein [Oscillospiraceae bacterium]